MKASQQRFLHKLGEQIQFLERSCEIYDHGEESEAIRIATSLRVIFHHTQKSTSLVEHLGFKKRKMLSTARGFYDWQDYLKVQINLNSKTPVKMLPMLGTSFSQVSIQQWWSNETVFKHNGKDYSRKLIALSAANKVGGAHVNSKLDQYYEVLAGGEYAFGLDGKNLTYSGHPPFDQGIEQYAKRVFSASKTVRLRDNCVS
jgi:hypothetical protein